MDYFSLLPDETVGQILREVPVLGRLRCKGVNRRWRRIVREQGWIGQKKLSSEIVFKGAKESQKEKFDNKSLVDLFRCVNVLELDLGSFFSYFRPKITPDVCRWLHLLPNLMQLHILGVEISFALEFIPTALTELSASGPFDEQSLTALSKKCPNLESIHFRGEGHHPAMKAFLEKYPKLKKLRLSGHLLGALFDQDTGLILLGKLPELEELYLEEADAFNDDALTAVATGCPLLKRLSVEDSCHIMHEMTLPNIGFSREVLGELEQHPNLLDFAIIYAGPFGSPESDYNIASEINERWKTKKYNILCSRMLTDDFMFRETLKELRIPRYYLHTPIDEFNRKKDDSVAKLIKRGFFSLLLTALSSTNAVLHLEAVATLVNITDNCSPQQLQVLFGDGLVPKLMELLDSSKNPVLWEHILNSIRILIDNEPKFRGHCIQLGIIDLLLKTIEEEKRITVLREAIRVVEALCKDHPMDFVQDILLALGKLIQNSDDFCLLKLCAIALSHIARRGNDQIQLVVDLGVVPRLVSLLDHFDERVRAAAISALANIVTGTPEQVHLVLDSGALRMMPTLFLRDHASVTYDARDSWFHYDTVFKESVRFLFAVASLGEELVQAVLDTGLLATIIQKAGWNNNEHVRFLISIIATEGRPEHVLYLVDHGVIPRLCYQLLTVCDFPLNLLVGLKNILAKLRTRTQKEKARQEILSCKIKIRYRGFRGALDEIKDLRNHQSEDIRTIASEIIDEFFPLDVNDSE